MLEQQKKSQTRQVQTQRDENFNSPKSADSSQQGITLDSMKTRLINKAKDLRDRFNNSALGKKIKSTFSGSTKAEQTFKKSIDNQEDINGPISKTSDASFDPSEWDYVADRSESESGIDQMRNEDVLNNFNINKYNTDANYQNKINEILKNKAMNVIAEVVLKKYYENSKNTADVTVEDVINLFDKVKNGQAIIDRRSRIKIPKESELMDELDQIIKNKNTLSYLKNDAVQQKFREILRQELLDLDQKNKKNIATEDENTEKIKAMKS